MALFEWNSSYETGIQIIDEQHKQLVEILSNLFESMRVGLGFKQIQHTIMELKDYTITHFSEEERYMKEINYPNYVEHVEVHKYFIENVEDFAKKYENGEIAISLQILDFLKNWLVNHILTVDKYIAIFEKSLNK